MKNRLAFCFLLPLAALLAAETPAPAGDGWQPLFDGETLKGWTSKNGSPTGPGWVVENGAIHRQSASGDIVSVGEYLNFELEFEWKASPKANSGLKYRVADYEPAGKGIGLEYQVLDDAGHNNGANPKTAAGSLYDLIPAATAKKLKPVGEWNSSRVVAKGALIEHWLNGDKVLSVDLSSEEWKKALGASKFRAAADFGTKKGRILLQDHGDEAWFRALRVRELPGA